MDYTMLIIGLGYPMSVIGAFVIASRMFVGEGEDE
jgi:hypothetical protein